MSRSIDIGKMKARLDPESGFITLSSVEKDSPLRQNGVLFNVSPGTQKYDILKEMIEEIPENKRVFSSGEKLPKVVYLGDKYRSKDSTTVPLGIDTDRRTVYWDTKTSPHLVIAGKTGTGKTTVAKSIVDHVNTHRQDSRAIYFNRNKELHEEVIRFENFKNVHESVQFIDTGNEELTISRVKEMMVERYNYLEETGLEDIEPGIRIGDFKRVFFMIDEFKRYPHSDPSRASEMLSDILRRGSSVGIHVAIVIHGTHEQAREYFPDAHAVITTQKVEGEGVTESIFRVTGDNSKRMKVFAIQR